MKRSIAFALFCVVITIATVRGQFNYDEEKVPKFDLPDPLTMQDGTKVKTAADWTEKRRPEVLRLFEEQVYGRAPEAPRSIRFKVDNSDDNALGGKAIRREAVVYFHPTDDSPHMRILMFIPKQEKPAPVFIGLNFRGNHSIHPDPKITLPTTWMWRAKDNRATPAGRGSAASRWPVEKLVKRGYAVATIYCGDIDPDHDDGFKNGIHPLYDKGERTPDQWGSIAAWSWGLSRAVDYLEQDENIDHQHIALIGHSRLGKTALWGGATDPRFGIVISNNSGCGGAALSRRRFGETVKRINTSFPHWFCDNFKKYNDAENDLPVDQHLLIALIAPRPVYVASAEQDKWADPRGEFLATKYAAPVYQLLGKKDVKIGELPRINKAVGGSIGYHIRSGKHDVTKYDWEQYLNFADKHFRS